MVFGKYIHLLKQKQNIMKSEAKIEGDFLVVRIPLSEIINGAFVPDENGDPFKGMQTKSREFAKELFANFRHNTPINRREKSLCDLGYKHRVEINGFVKELERRGMVKVDRLPSFPHHIRTFTIL